jgi:uncharacterized membrane protein
LNLLLLGLTLFLGAHLVSAVPALRGQLVLRLGTPSYKGLFVLTSFAGLALIIHGKRYAPFVSLWEPPAWGYTVAQLLMPLSLILLAGAFIPGNIRRHTRHPMLWGVALWALTHLFANGDLASVLIFAGFGAYAMFAMWSLNRRGARLQATPRPRYWDVVVVAVGLAAYVSAGLGHRYLAGVPAFS